MEQIDDDNEFYETSFSHAGIYDQFILFIMDETGVEYPPDKPKPYNPEVASDGNW